MRLNAAHQIERKVLMVKVKLFAIALAALLTVGVAGHFGGSVDHSTACAIGDCW
jgi:hypothetical protein